MAQPEDEEKNYLTTLNALEAVQEDINNYQGLLKDLPEIYERKFNERLKPILDRQQSLTVEREQLLRQLQQALPAAETEGRALPPSTTHPLPTTDEVDRPSPSRRGKPWWLLGLAALGLAIGLQLNRPVGPGTPKPAKPAPSSVARPSLPQGLSVDTPATTLRGRVVERAIAEWTLFDQPTLRNGQMLRAGRQEGDFPQWRRVVTYWREGLLSRSVNNRADVISRDHPWSAAFLAYVMKQAGAGDQFPYAASHSGSIKEAIYNRLHSVDSAHLIGHRVNDYSPRPGDLLCATRSWATGQVNYDNVNRFDFFPSRCELVINASSGQIVTIGGDLMDAVTLHTIKAINGRVAPESAPDWLVAIQTQIN
jgi:hypothetical protein